MHSSILSMVGRTDSYKLGHWRMLPPNCKEVLSYAEPRGGQFGYTVFFGLEYYLHKYLSSFNNRITPTDVEYVAARTAKHFGDNTIFNYDGWMDIATRLEGRLPLDIRAVPEGTKVPVGNVVMTIRNTDEKHAWLTNYVETLLLKVWYPSTVATLSREAKQILKSYLEETGDPSKLPFMLHDFGYRGVSSEESADIGGMAHMINFSGSDTFHANLVAEDVYGAEMASFSVPATEHSVMTMGGPEGETALCERLMKEFPDGILSLVCDSYDTYNFCRNVIGTDLKAKVLQRDGVTVIRPDSGANIVNVVVNCLEILGEKFGVTTNDKGYKVLNPKIRVLQGDGLDIHRIKELCEGIKTAHWSLDNIATLGMGGGLLQKVNRDTQQWALKCCSAILGEDRVDVFKDPKTDHNKKSKRGWLDIVETPNGLVTINRDDKSDPNNKYNSILERRFYDGRVIHSPKWNEIKERAE